MILKDAVAARRTFAIISHPDAGKTTLTEKLLLYGGAIHVAGSVAARKRQRQATSDWMELEKQRGISITSTVLQFPYRGFIVNLLDTPGHQDFGEDTYRTLIAADAAVMLIDAGKGVEPQTKKLFAICRERGIPIFTFMNKLDRPSRDPLELLDELESVLGIGAYPMNWPLGNGPSFRGIYDRQERAVHLFERTVHGATMAPVQVADPRDDRVRALLDAESYGEFLAQLDLLDGAGADFSMDDVLAGRVSPVFFGSAVTNFGVQLFLDRFVSMAPPPSARKAGDRYVDPGAEHFSAFVFKIQANMDPRHHDSVAFVRVCSGALDRDLVVRDSRTGKTTKLTRAMKLFGNERQTLDAAYAGDVVGIANNDFAIGDTLCDGATVIFDPIPSFQPECFAGLRVTDTSAYKRFQKGIAQLADEGAIQLMWPRGGVRSEPILAAVGRLQFDVVRFRLESEYNTQTILETLPYEEGRWIQGAPEAIAELRLPTGARLVEDRLGRPLALFSAAWAIEIARERNPGLRFLRLDELDHPGDEAALAS
ncbi:MAG: peptide chain release factor 3 [bacterium]|nr:peptide chain release factor 3 [bacterium]